jgi:hypothetical protein
MAVIPSGLVERSARSSTLAIAGFVIAVGATALVASVPGSPLHPVLPPGVEPGGPFRWVADLVGLGDLRGSALVTASVVAVIASAVTFVFVVREAWRGRSRSGPPCCCLGANVLGITMSRLTGRDVYRTCVRQNHARAVLPSPSDPI